MRVVKKTGLLACCLLMAAQASEKKSGLTPDQALTQLLAGNKRYVNSQLQHPHQNAIRRHELEKGQHPFACILSCSDSRTPPEIVFDEGLGDLFVIRVAGNVVDDAVTGSIEYAVEHLGTPIVLVMGHESCGAVQAAIGGGEPKTHIQSLVEAIAPAVAEARKEKGDLIANAVRANVRLAVKQLRESKPLLAEQVEKKKIRIVGAVYELTSGQVELLPER
jgi:carbonic anhydrase